MWLCRLVMLWVVGGCRVMWMWLCDYCSRVVMVWIWVLFFSVVVVGVCWCRWLRKVCCMVLYSSGVLL